MGFKTQTKKVVGCSECRLHALCVYCLGLVPRPKAKGPFKSEKMNVEYREYLKLWPSKEA